MTNMDEATLFQRQLSIRKVEPLQNPEEIALAEAKALSEDDSDWKAWALYELARRLAAGEQWDKAEAIARSITRPYERAKALKSISLRLFATGQGGRALKDLDEALTTALNDQPFWIWQRAESLAWIAAVLAQVNERRKAQEVWSEAIKVARVGEQEANLGAIDCSIVLLEIAEGMALTGDLENAKAIVKSIRFDAKREKALCVIQKIANGELTIDQYCWE